MLISVAAAPALRRRRAPDRPAVQRRCTGAGPTRPSCCTRRRAGSWRSCTPPSRSSPSAWTTTCGPRWSRGGCGGPSTSSSAAGEKSLVGLHLWSSILAGALAERRDDDAFTFVYYEDLDPSEHARFIPIGRLKQRLVQQVFRRKDVVVANTNRVADAMVRVYGLETRPRVISPAVDLFALRAAAEGRPGPAEPGVRPLQGRHGGLARAAEGPGRGLRGPARLRDSSASGTWSARVRSAAGSTACRRTAPWWCGRTAATRGRTRWSGTPMCSSTARTPRRSAWCSWRRSDPACRS